jgi:hypothetical protein
MDITSTVNVITNRLLCDAVENGSSRVIRRRTAALTESDYLRRSRPMCLDPMTNAMPGVFSITENGLAALAEYKGDEGYLLRPSSPPEITFIRHELLVSAKQLTLMKAISIQDKVQLVRTIREGHVVNLDEPDPAHQRTLRMDLSNGRPLYCHPDMAFVLQVGTAQVAYCVEVESGTNGAKRKVARCWQGYYHLSKTGRYIRLFPHVTKHPFGVLAIAPTRGYRDQMRKAMVDKPGRELWLFAAEQDLTPETFLFEPVWYACNSKTPIPLINQ